jgi:hypothetical protein
MRGAWARMPSYSELVDLARLCWRQSHLAQTEGVARELRRMALQYQQEAAKLDGGKSPVAARRFESQVKSKASTLKSCAAWGRRSGLPCSKT